jgi:hypothetical protein
VMDEGAHIMKHNIYDSEHKGLLKYPTEFPENG